MQTARIVYCDKGDCKKLFAIDLKRRKVGKHEGKSIYLNYFVCSGCKTEYPAFYQSEETERLTKKIQECRMKIGKLQGGGKSKIAEIENLMGKVLNYEAKLKAIHKFYKLKFEKAPA